MPRAANVRRSLPKAVFDRLEEGRRNNKPYSYTDADVRAIARFVSQPVNNFNQLEVDLANSSKARGGAPLPTKHEARLAWRCQEPDLSGHVRWTFRCIPVGSLGFPVVPVRNSVVGLKAEDARPWPKDVPSE